MATQATEVIRLTGTNYQSNNAKKQVPCFSASAARVNDEEVVLYLGTHGSSLQIRMNDTDAETLYLILEEMIHARIKS